MDARLTTPTCICGQQEEWKRERQQQQRQGEKSVSNVFFQLFCLSDCAQYIIGMVLIHSFVLILPLGVCNPIDLRAE